MSTIVTSAKGLKIHLIQENKFKTIRIVVRFRELINQENLAKRALLSNIFEVSTARYATSSDFEAALAMNYGTRLSSSVSNKGLQHFLTVALSVVEPRFVGEDTLKTAVDFLQAVIFEPKLSGEQFDKSVFEVEKNNLQRYFDALQDDNSYLAAKGLSELYFDKEEFRLSNMGSTEQLQAVDAKRLYDYYQAMLATNVMDIFVLGNIHETEVADLFATWQFGGESELNEIFYQQAIKPFESRLVEKEAFQSQLALAWNLPIQYGDKDYMALQLFNALYGSQPNSKLFSVVREKESLAYSISSYFDSFSGQFRVLAGIDPADYNRAKDLTLELFEAMKQGDFSNEDLAQCKALLRNAFLSSQDNLANLVEEAFIDQILPDRKLSSDEWLSQLEAVSKAEIQAVGKRLTLQSEFQVKGVFAK